MLAENDGAAAGEWATRRPAGAGRRAAIEGVATEWSKWDPDRAAKWIEQMPAGLGRDIAAAHVTMVVYADPEVAAEWVEQVADSTERANAAERVFYVWKWENPIAAHAWLRALPASM